jgi:hypothetical protein
MMARSKLTKEQAALLRDNPGKGMLIWDARRVTAVIPLTKKSKAKRPPKKTRT